MNMMDEMDGKPTKLEAIRALFIDDVGKAWKLASVWFFVALGASPELYDAFVANGMFDSFPPHFKLVLKVIAGAGILSRIVKQHLPGE